MAVQITETAQEAVSGSVEQWQDLVRWATRNSDDLLAAGGTALAISLLLIGLRAIGFRLLRGERSGGWRLVLGRVLAKTNAFFIIMLAVELVASWTRTPRRIEDVIDILFIIAASLQGAVWLRALLLSLIENRLGDSNQSGLGSAIGIIRLLVTVALFAIAFVVILDNLGVNVTALVAGLGIGGIAIGLAAQGIFSDLFAALAIIFDRPFRRGDVITFGNPPTTGVVQHIGLKSTRLRSLNGEEVVMANTKLLEQQLQNWAMLTSRRAVMMVGLTYQTPADVLERLGSEVEAIVSAQPKTRFERAHIFQFAPSSLDMEIVFHVESAEYGEFMDVRQAVVLGILRRFAELGAAFAYPTTTNFTAAPDGNFVLPYAAPMPARPA